ncbi:hypothetical protein H4R18_002244 [Coemansia javaensis]|uniref:CUE domain-containing protein n=1 Tax=Coemansia javaensis TaxID=2761396 RepID=A0A9W8HFN5_9FUNG|nr:hypothetical protein H4R18_002244 [Coemansia javaensis]
MTRTLAEQITDALAGPSDSSFVAWLVDEAGPASAAIESALLRDGDGGDEAAAGVPSQETVLRVFEKLAESLADPATHELARGLQSGGVLVGATLFDLTCAFSSSHPQRLLALVAGLCEHAPWLGAEIEAAADLLVEQLEQFQEKYRAHVATVEGAFDAEFVARASDDMEWYQSVAWSWLTMIEFCPPAVAVLAQDSRFVLELAKTSDVATKLLLKLGEDGHTAGAAQVDACKELIRKLKWQWIGLAYGVLKALFDAAAAAPADASIDRDANTAVLLDILEAMETGDATLTPFDNAPFLLDLEFRFGLRHMIRVATAVSGPGLDSAQMDYLTMTIDQLVAMTQPLFRDGLGPLTARVRRAESLAADRRADVDGVADRLAAASLADGNDDAAVAQVQEMIPGLGRGFVRACLAHHAGSAEAVVNALLENDLPAPLAEMDRAAEAWEPPASDGSASDDKDTAAAAAAPDVLASRRNVFDGDAFDIFRNGTLDWSRVSKGKTQADDAGPAEDDMLRRVMDLARRIAEEDEYDDAYDNTAQDNALEPGEGPDDDPTRPWEEDLVRLHESDPKCLEKEGRKSAARRALREKTGLSDEQIEGWHTMLVRNPARQKHLLAKYAWQGEQDEAPQDGPQEQPGRPLTASRKEKNKARIGNHDRKKQHARKNQQHA